MAVRVVSSFSWVSSLSEVLRCLAQAEGVEAGEEAAEGFGFCHFQERVRVHGEFNGYFLYIYTTE